MGRLAEDHGLVSLVLPVSLFLTHKPIKHTIFMNPAIHALFPAAWPVDTDVLGDTGG